MKSNKKTWIIAIVAIVAILLFSMIGINIGILLYFALLIAVGYIIIDGISMFANRLIEALEKKQSVNAEEINTKMELMMQKIQDIENKVDKINIILEKVSE